MSDIRIVMKDGRRLESLSADERKTLLGQFGSTYAQELEKELASHPEDYAWKDKSHDEVLRVVSRMINAIYHGRANNSNALKRAVKKFGLNGSMKYTEAFVRACLQNL